MIGAVDLPAALFRAGAGISRRSGSGTALIVFLAAATAGSFIAGRLMVRIDALQARADRRLALGIVMLAAVRGEARRAVARWRCACC